MIYTIRYGIWRKVKRKTESRNSEFTIDLPADPIEDAASGERVRGEIYARNPGWMVQGYTAIAGYPILHHWPDEIPDGSVWEWTSSGWDLDNPTTERCDAMDGRMRRHQELDSSYFNDGDTIQRIS